LLLLKVMPVICAEFPAPAEAFMGAIAVITDAALPNERLLEFDRVNAESVAAMLPAERPIPWLPVMVLPLSPNDTPLLLLKTMLPRPPLLVPALMVTLPAAALGADAVMTPLEMPQEMLFELAKVNEFTAVLVLGAEIVTLLMSPAVLGTV